MVTKREKCAIPLGVAVPILVVVVGAALLVHDVRAEVLRLESKLEAGTRDRFTSQDQDRFSERLQVEFDDHTRQLDMMPFQVPSWRAR